MENACQLSTVFYRIYRASTIGASVIGCEKLKTKKRSQGEEVLSSCPALLSSAAGPFSMEELCSSQFAYDMYIPVARYGAEELTD
jgi:hypothetical protein